MKLSKLLKNLLYDSVNFNDIDIKGVVHSSKNVEKDYLFFALSGDKFDGIDYIDEVLERGGKVVVTEKDIVRNDLIVVKVADVRYAMSIIAKNFYRHVDEKLKIVGVVGTNGKTTTSTIIYEILRKSGKKVGLIGTNGVLIGDIVLPTNMTTPDPIELHYIFSQMYAFGVEYVVMEVSAHAIYYQKIAGINFDIGVFTNVSPEHLDFFRDMENYSQIKESFFSSQYVKECVVNIDDERGRKLAYSVDIPCVSYGMTRPANIFAIDIMMTIDKMSFVVNAFDEIYKLNTCLVGDYNVYNIMAAIGAVRLLGVGKHVVEKTLNSMKGVDGRWEVLSLDCAVCKNVKIVVDFAHTSEAFDRVLSLIRRLRKGRVITLFGCVGYSDKDKRKKMGDIVSKYSDFVVFTTDNICDADFYDTVKEVDLKIPHVFIEDREEAIEYAFKNLQDNDTVVLLGKGNEKVQKVRSELFDFDEIKIVKNIIKNIENA